MPHVGLARRRAGAHCAGRHDLGALVTTVAVGVIAAFVIGDGARRTRPVPHKTWVAVIDVMAAVLLAARLVFCLRRPRNPAREEKAVPRYRRWPTRR